MAKRQRITNTAERLKRRPVRQLGADLRKAALTEHLSLVDLFLSAGLLTQEDIHLWQDLRSVEAFHRMRGSRREYIRYQRCAPEARKLIETYRPALWAQIVAEGRLTPSQRRRLAQKGA